MFHYTRTENQKCLLVENFYSYISKYFESNSDSLDLSQCQTISHVLTKFKESKTEGLTHVRIRPCASTRLKPTNINSVKIM